MILLWHNQGYEEIRRFMDDAGVARLGVDLRPPDFQTLAAGFGCAATRVAIPSDLTHALATRPADGPLLIEVDAVAWADAIAHA